MDTRARPLFFRDWKGHASTRNMMRSFALSLSIGCTLALLAQRPAQGQEVAPPAAGRMLTQYAPGVLAKTSFRGPTRDAMVVEIWDLVVGPGKRSESFTLPGGAVLEVKSGQGRAELAAKPQELRLGTVVTVIEGDTIVLANTDAEASLVLRAVIVRSVRP